MLWSPPYFDLERYSDEPTQSCVRFPDRESWLSEYFDLQRWRTCTRRSSRAASSRWNVSEDMLPDSIEALGVGFAFVRAMEYAQSRMIGSKHQAKRSEVRAVADIREARARKFCPVRNGTQ